MAPLDLTDKHLYAPMSNEDDASSKISEALLRKSSSATLASAVSGTVSETRIHQASILDTFTFFLCGVGTTLCQNAILSCLVYWSEIFGDSAYVYISFAIFTPLLPTALAQATWDEHFDEKITRVTAYTFRGATSFISSIIITMGVIPDVTSFWVLCLSCFMLGFSQAILFGSMNQLATLVSKCGRLKAGYSFGFQASGIVTLVVNLATGFGTSSSEDGKMLYYATVTVIQAVCFGAFLRLVICWGPIKMVLTRLDYISSCDTSSVASLESENLAPSIREILLVTDAELSYKELLRRSLKICISLTLTIASSMAMGAWFTKVKSPTVSLPQLLFYTRLFADALGRPATLLFPVSSVGVLLILTFVRLSIVPIFFQVAGLSSNPEQNDVILVLVVAILSFSSGYIVTVCYQLAPTLLSPEENINLAKQASLLNISFSIAAVAGVNFSLFLLIAGV